MRRECGEQWAILSVGRPSQAFRQRISDFPRSNGFYAEDEHFSRSFGHLPKSATDPVTFPALIEPTITDMRRYVEDLLCSLFPGHSIFRQPCTALDGQCHRKQRLPILAIKLFQFGSQVSVLWFDSPDSESFPKAKRPRRGSLFINLINQATGELRCPSPTLPIGSFLLSFRRVRGGRRPQRTAA